MARPAMLEQKPELIDEVAGLLEKGHHPPVVMRKVGISIESYHAWRRRGQKEEADGLDTVYVRFCNAVTRAIATAEIDLHDTLRDGETEMGFGNRKASLEILKRRFPKRWADRVNFKVEQELGELLEVVERICSPEDFERVLAAIAARDSEGEAGGDTGE